MQIFRHHDGLPAAARGAVVAIGNFDGLHRGHQAVIGTAQTLARQLAAPAAVLAFEPHPRAVFRPADPPFRLTPFHSRARLLTELGLDLHVVLRFDQAFAVKTAEAFIDEVLVQGLGARHVVVGWDFRFGHRRLGTAETLAAAGATQGFAVTTVQPAKADAGEPFSSSRIRQHLAEGRPRDAARLLGRPWEIEGRVIPGDRRGRELGYPTANIDLDGYLRPAFGIYAIRAALDDAGPVWRPGVANLGLRPMFATPTPLLEAHLFDFDGDLYGRHLRVQLVDYLRPEARFDSLDAMIAQMDRDAAAARALLVQP